MRSALLIAALLAAMVPQAALAARDLGYNIDASPVQALSKAKRAVATNGKKILVIAGGDWCRWCHVLDRFLSRNKDVKSELTRTFEVVKVYVGEENDNAAFFSRWPKASGYPHFWVLSSDGRVMASVNTGKLEAGPDDYNKLAFLAFIKRFAPRT